MTSNARIGIFGPGNVLVTGGSFTQINQTQSETGFTTLSQKISHGAMYDSADRYAAGRCHPGTREEIIALILDWINNPSPETDILWLWGPAGVGKSSILQTIAELLNELHPERYAGSFFFAKGVPGRGQGMNLFSTLGYQIACNVSDTREAVNTAMILDPLLPGKNMATQFNFLIARPLSDLPSVAVHTPTIIIDGLDECEGSDDQRAILALITKSLTNSQRVPLRFIIASRPEHAIRDEFDRPVLAKITERIELSQSRQASRDIRKYLQDGFNEIYQKNQDIMEDVDTPWPSLDRVNLFVRNASGQFVYASTVLKFIGSYSDFSDPQRQLEVICKPGASRAEAFTSLDQLYTAILTHYPRRDKLKLVLGGLFVKTNVKTIVSSLEVGSSEFRLVMRAISSLVKLPRAQINIDSKDLDAAFGPLEVPITFAHLSFRDFLQDRTRSGEFWVNTQEIYTHLYNKFIDIIISQLNGGDQHPSSRLAIPIAYNDYWGAYSFWTIPKLTPPAILFDRLHDLREALGTFIQESRSTELHILQNTLQALRAANKFIGSITKDFYKIEPTFTVTDHKNLQLQLRKAMDICFQQTILLGRFIQPKKAPVFILTGGTLSLDKISKCLGITASQATEYLKNNKHLIECDIDLVHHRAKNQDVLTRCYYPFQTVVSFLLDESRGGILHHQFRKVAISTWRDLVVEFVEGKYPLSEDAYAYISEFLSKKTLTRLQRKDDPDIMAPLIKGLCELNWSAVDALSGPGGDEVFDACLDILQFLHQILNNQVSATVLNDTAPWLQSSILESMEKIYEAIIIRHTSSSYFSEGPAALALLTFPPPQPLSDAVNESATGIPIPPYHIKPVDLDQMRDYESTFTDKFHRITAMLQGAKYKPPIDPSVLYTSMLEFLLHFWATEFYQCSESPISSVTGRRCQALFKYAKPSLKIRVALWTLRDLDARKRLRPNLPISIVVSVQDFLMRYPDLDTEKILSTWLDELKQRSIARKKTHPDSDIPSDVESTDSDDESDLTDINHDDDHGYEVEAVPEIEDDDGDLESIYAWGD